MTRKRCKELLPIMQAFAEGKEIQFKENNTWKTVEEVDYSWNPVYYRIKPTEEYRPYKDCDEMIADYKARFNTNCSSYAMPLIWVKHKQSNCRYLIHTYAENEVYINNDRYTLEELFEYFEYLNGSKIGVRV